MKETNSKELQILKLPDTNFKITVMTMFKEIEDKKENFS